MFNSTTDQPYALNRNGTTYYYITNPQGDVVRLVDIYGNGAAYYEYDPYGNAIYAGGSHANITPLRYRGYVYDSLGRSFGRRLIMELRLWLSAGG